MYNYITSNLVCTNVEKNISCTCMSNDEYGGALPTYEHDIKKWELST